MTLEDLLSQVGVGTKQLTDRFSGEYGAPVQDQHIYYHSYEQPAHTATSKHHHHSGGGLKSNASMSALTLLAFLFFLHILQQCIKEHMNELSNSSPVVVMSASREGMETISKATSKLDKTGNVPADELDKASVPLYEDYVDEYEKNPYKSNKGSGEKMLKINAAEHKPKHFYKNYRDSAKIIPTAVGEN